MPEPRTVSRVELRPVRREDLPVLYAHETDADAAAQAGVKPRDEASFYALWERILADESVTERAVLADDKLAGRAACFPSNGRLELGCWIGREFWGLGVASRAMGLLLDIVDERPVYGQIQAGNTASIRMTERLGFEKIGEADEPETERYTAGRVLTYRLS